MNVVEGPKDTTIDEGEPATFVSKITGYPGKGSIKHRTC
jgi:hypothetical protein